MKHYGYKINISWLKYIIIFSVIFTSSCVYDKEFTYLNDQIVVLNKRVTELEKSIDRKIDVEMKQDLEQTLQPINTNQAQMRIELDQIKEDMRESSGRIEDNEHLLRRTVEKDLGEQDAVKSEIADLSKLGPRVEELERMVTRQQEYLNLEPERKESKEGGEQSAESETGKAPGSREGEQYDLALALFKSEKFEQAIDGFKRFLQEFPKSDLADNAQFWIGECFMALKQYEQAILAYQEVIKKYSKGNKVPNAMLRQAVAFLEIKDETSSKLLLKKLIKQYPDSSEAKIAQRRLKKLE